MQDRGTERDRELPSTSTAALHFIETQSSPTLAAQMIESESKNKWNLVWKR
jgi:hypothetical protein